MRGGAEHQLPLIISRLTPGTPAALCKQLYIGDAILASKSKCTPFSFSIAVAMYQRAGAIQHANGAKSHENTS